MSHRFSLIILVGMTLGVLVGWICHAQLSDRTGRPTSQADLSIVTDVFLRLIKMIIAPLVFSTLVAGIANMGVGAQLGRIGAAHGALVPRRVGDFVAARARARERCCNRASGLGLPLPPEGTHSAIQAGALTLKDFVTHVFPRSIIEAMSTNEILQIVVFSLFMGVALASLGERAAGIVCSPNSWSK